MKKNAYILRRSVKKLRNLISDPLPRNNSLFVRRVELSGVGFNIVYSTHRRDYTINVFLPGDLRELYQQHDEAALAPTMASISIAFAPFLFKLSDFSRVVVEPFDLDDDACSFFSRFLQGGLGEFRYLQGLDPSRAIIVEGKSSARVAPSSYATEDRVLMLNGGGKDTIVAGELLKQACQAFTWVTIRPNAARRSVVGLSGNANSIEIGYDFDGAIERDKVYPWGHFPHTSLVLCLGLLVAQLTGARYVCAGNEHSANFGNLKYRGFEVNHQYSKSFEYEKGLNTYVTQCVTADISIFSILRPFHDLQLAMIFAHFQNYHEDFISCNRGITRNEWCMDCPKCAFTALALYPFIGKIGVVRVFGEDVLRRPSIRKHILELVDSEVKPWECVGTLDENRLALKLLLERNADLDFDEEPRRSDLESSVAGLSREALEMRILGTTEREHLIPKILKEKLNVVLAKFGVPAII